MSVSQKEEAAIQLEVVCDADTGHVFAARALDMNIIGEDPPDQVRLEVADNQVCELIEITAEQARGGLAKLFATHKLSKGRLIPN